MSLTSIPTQQSFVEEILSGLKIYVQLTLINYILVTCTFDLWMSKGTRDVFVVVVNFISSDWKARHVTIKLFEISNTSDVAMALKL